MSVPPRHKAVCLNKTKFLMKRFLEVYPGRDSVVVKKNALKSKMAEFVTKIGFFFKCLSFWVNFFKGTFCSALEPKKLKILVKLGMLSFNTSQKIITTQRISILYTPCLFLQLWRYRVPFIIILLYLLFKKLGGNQVRSREEKQAYAEKVWG